MVKGQGNVEDRVKDRYNGTKDPLAEKIETKIEGLKKINKMPEAPRDRELTTLFIGDFVGGVGVHPTLAEEKILARMLSDKFEPYGKVKGVRLLASKACAFVCFRDREAAEMAFSTLYERLFMPVNGKSKKLRLLWAKT